MPHPSSSQTIVEILSYSVSETLLMEDPNLEFTKEALDYLRGTEWCLGAMRGCQEEKKTQVIIAIGWESYAHYKKATEAAEYSTLIPSSLRPNLAGKFETQIVQFDVYPTAAFSAPITEFVTFTMKPGPDIRQRGEAMMKHIKSMDNVSTDGDHGPGRILPVSFGVDVDREGIYVLAVGWASKQAHKEFLKKFVTTADQTKERVVYDAVSSVDMRHVVLRV